MFTLQPVRLTVAPLLRMPACRISAGASVRHIGFSPRFNCGRWYRGEEWALGLQRLVQPMHRLTQPLIQLMHRQSRWRLGLSTYSGEEGDDRDDLVRESHIVRASRPEDYFVRWCPGLCHVWHCPMTAPRDSSLREKRFVPSERIAAK